MRRLGRFWGGLALVAILGAGCAAPTAISSGSTRELVLGYDDARATGTLAFPSGNYESMVRFQLPDGEHRPLRIRFQAEAVGRLEITIYDNTLFETPGAAIRTLTRDLSADDLSNGTDGRWVIEDLAGLKPLKGTVWVGVHKTGGTPTIWASGVVCGQTFVRDNDPANPMGLLPTRRTPMIRLELVP